MMACAMSALVFAGGSQFAAVGIVASGGSLVMAVVSALFLNARYVPMGLALAAKLGPRSDATSWRAVVTPHLLIDESAAIGLSAPSDNRRVFAWTGAAIFVTWNVGTVAGAVLGSSIGDTRMVGLDAAIPAAMVAMLAPALRDERGRWVAIVGAAVALLLMPIAPPGVPVLAAAVAALVARDQPSGSLDASEVAQ